MMTDELEDIALDDELMDGSEEPDSCMNTCG